MTMRQRDKVTCNCGHVGSIKFSENDQPYSEIWESWSLENLDGSICDNPKSASDILTRSNIKCPECKSTITKEMLQ